MDDDHLPDALTREMARVREKVWPKRAFSEMVDRVAPIIREANRALAARDEPAMQRALDALRGWK